MTYRSDRQIVEELLPVRLFAVVIAEGIEKPDGDDARQLLAWLKQSQDEIIAALAQKKADALIRRAKRTVDIVKQPFVDANAAVAKFGLVIFYLLDCLRRSGVFGVVDGSAFDMATTAILSPEGTVTDLANIEKVDASAKKQARKMLADLQSEGYFRGYQWIEQ